MKLRRKQIIGIGVLLLIGLLVYFWLKTSLPPEAPNASESATPAATATPRPDGKPLPVRPDLAKPDEKEPHDTSDQIEILMKLLKTPIAFYGKVVDDKGNPIEGADVKISVQTQLNPYESNPKYSRRSDKDGLFSITGVQGASVYIAVSKNGYYKIEPSDGQVGSAARIRYADAGDRANTELPIPTKDNPTVFVLRKMGETEPLIVVRQQSVLLPKNGTPVDISLRTGKVVPTGQGDIRVECHTQDQNKDAQGHYPWTCTISVPGGGLVERTGGFEFTAPTEGYQSSVVLGPPEERWVSFAERQYFVKTAKDQYARIEINLRTGGDHFMMIDSYLNPQAGSRNLEYDPEKRLNP